MMYTAYHAPSKMHFEFANKNLANQYVKDAICDCCKKKKCKGYMAEWFILPTNDFKKAKSFDDILAASGWVQA